jgi:hypothetical protein
MSRRFLYQLYPRAQTELGVDVSEMAPYGARSDEQSRGDVLIGQPVTDLGCTEKTCRVTVTSCITSNFGKAFQRVRGRPVSVDGGCDRQRFAAVTFRLLWLIPGDCDASA